MEIYQNELARRIKRSKTDNMFIFAYSQDASNNGYTSHFYYFDLHCANVIDHGGIQNTKQAGNARWNTYNW